MRDRLFSRIAISVTAGYAALIVALLVAAKQNSDLEGRAYDLLFIGFPWDLWAFVLRQKSMYFYALAIFLNLVACRRVTITRLLASDLSWLPTVKSCSLRNSIPI